MKTEYKFLEFVRGEKIPYIQGSRRDVGNLGADFYNWGYREMNKNGEQTGQKALARDTGLPLEVVLEALAWFDKNKELVESEFRRIRKELGAKD